MISLPETGLVQLAVEEARVINVASVPQRSPFRYPGGKTWLVPTLRTWLQNLHQPNATFAEIFAGGAISSLTAVMEGLCKNAVIIEKDPEVAYVWDLIFNHADGADELANSIECFDLTPSNVSILLGRESKTLLENALTTIVKNRVFHGGIIAKGSGMIKNGENGKGILSRWYPQTLKKRIMNIKQFRDKIIFMQGDAFDFLESEKRNQNIVFFIDPPYYTAGKRLYTYSDINHDLLFSEVAHLTQSYLMTYDKNPTILNLIEKNKFSYAEVPMKTTLHYQKSELLICNSINW